MPNKMLIKICSDQMLGSNAHKNMLRLNADTNDNNHF